jgi:SAM-dependent methyltransferase
VSDRKERADADLERLRAHYDGLVRRHGSDPAGAQYSDRATQEKRFEVLTEVGDLADAAILDYGCGTGSLLAFLRVRGYRGDFCGQDISPEAIAVARDRFPDARFEVGAVAADTAGEPVDYAFVSGVFNNLVTDNWSMLTHGLSTLYGLARKAVAFNALSTYVDYKDSGLYYADPLEVFDFCKSTLSPFVTLRHDYELKAGVPPYEFTIYVHKTDRQPTGRLLA